MTDKDASLIEYREPPLIDRPFINPDNFWAKVAAMATAKPGEWVWAGRHASGVVTRIRKGKAATFRPPEHWEAIGRDVDAHRRLDVYVRFIGGAS